MARPVIPRRWPEEPVALAQPAHILLLCEDRPPQAATVLEHIDAFRRLSRHRVRAFNPRNVDRGFLLDLMEFDAVVLHYTLFATRPRPFSPDLLERLASFPGLKVAFIQDEYRWVDETTALAREIGIHVLFTVAPEPAAGRLYDERLPGVERRLTLTGYVPDSMVGIATPRMRNRNLHVVYRGRALPFWLGSLAQEKVLIGDGFLARADRHGLLCDIGWREDQRLYGASWTKFMTSGRATLGTESGASIADFDGSIERSVKSYLASQPDAPFAEVEAAVLSRYEGNVRVNVISPRVFEAACLRTGLVMFPGEYSGVVTPSVHYIVLEKDFSNLAEVAAQLKDDDFMEQLVTRTYNDLVASGRWSLKGFIGDFDDAVEQRCQPLKHRSARRYWLARGVRVATLARPHRSLVQATLRLLGSRRLATDPSNYARKGMIAVRAILVDPALRRLYYASRSTGASLSQTLEELLELAILRRALGRHFPFAVEVDVQTNGDLLFKSVPDSVDEGVPRGVVEKALSSRCGITWDHRRVGATVHWNGTEVAIGESGLARFAIVSRLTATQPALVAKAILPGTSTRRMRAE